MDVSVRELRDNTAEVMAAVENGQEIVLTVRGCPVADIVPRRPRGEQDPGRALVGDLNGVAVPVAADRNGTDPAR
jgi:prevent-host-death family protein